MGMTAYADITAHPEYDKAFWAGMSDKVTDVTILDKGKVPGDGTYKVPTSSSNELTKAISRESLFRCMSTVINATGNGYRLDASDSDDLAMFVEEGGEIPVYNAVEDFTRISVGSHKLVSFVKLDEDFVKDASFNMEKYLIKRFGRCFGRAEDKAFITGSGIKEPTGILHATDGAKVGIITDSLSFDDVISLYFNTESQYRKNGMWLMNDATALALRKLKDKDGNYLWNQANDTILGKSVIISEYMPDIEAGAKPIAFGDFSYYWVIVRHLVAMRMLKEAFVLHAQLGYLAAEYIDGKLVRKDAVKVLQIAE